MLSLYHILELMYRLSNRNVVFLWSMAVLISIIVVWSDCYVLFPCDLPLLLSLISIVYGFVGTIVIGVPSISTGLGRNDSVQDALEFNQLMHSAYDELENGATLSNRSEEFEAILAYIHSESDYDDVPSTISLGSSERASKPLMVDSRIVGLNTLDLVGYMHSYMNKAERYEESVAEDQERKYVLLGCGIYGIAIIFQSLSTIISNISRLII